jgi:taurine dioxygenase
MQTVSTVTLETRQLNGEFGLEISGIDLSADIPAELFNHLIDLYSENSVLLFRDQQLTPASLAGLTHRFGNPKIETRKQFNFQEHPEVSTLGNIAAADGKLLSFFARGGFGWHTDGSAACHVNAATFLYAVKVPREGGDTLFLSTANAYEQAPKRIKDALESVSILSSFHAHNDPLLQSDPDSFIALTEQERAALPAVWHRLVQTHPVTGRKVFYLNFDPLEFDGIDDETGRALLQELLELASQPEFVYRHQWRPGELIIWDNHAMLHSGTPTLMYEADRRLMYRAFVYTLPTARPLPNYAEVSQIFMPNEQSISLADFN